MKHKFLLAIFLLFLILITGCNAYNTNNQDIINDGNIGNVFVYKTLGNISFRMTGRSVGANIGLNFKKLKITKDDFPYKEDEQIDEQGKLLNDKMYVEIDNSIKNNSNKKVEVNLEDFYLVIRGENGKIARGTTDLRYAYLNDNDEKATLDKFKLTLDPFGESIVETIYIEDLSNVLDPTSVVGSNCYYRVKSNKQAVYYNISLSSSPNPD